MGVVRLAQSLVGLLSIQHFVLDTQLRHAQRSNFHLSQLNCFLDRPWFNLSAPPSFSQVVALESNRSSVHFVYPFAYQLQLRRCVQ